MEMCLDRCDQLEELQVNTKSIKMKKADKKKSTGVMGTIKGWFGSKKEVK
jgi:hypothetical protein